MKSRRRRKRRCEKIRQDPVGVGGTDKPAYGQTHELGEVSGQDVPKIPGGHHKVHPRPGLYPPPAQKRPVGNEIIDHLRGKPADIDGVGRGKA